MSTFSAGYERSPESKALLDKLGKHKTGVGCLYINKLSDVDVTVLQAMRAVSYPYVVGNLGV